MTSDELNTLMNAWELGTVGHQYDRAVLAKLNEIGAQIGYGALEQYAHWLYLAQCRGLTRKAADLKRSRFGSLGWKLPADFEAVAAKGADNQNDEPQDGPAEEMKTVEELLTLGGKFYSMGNEAWCDTALHSWKLIPGKGYVRQP